MLPPGTARAQAHWCLWLLYNPQEVEAGGLEVQGSSGLHGECEASLGFMISLKMDGGIGQMLWLLGALAAFAKD